MSAQEILLLALVSASSRAGLNIIDRLQIGHKGLSIIGLNFLNNIIPAFFCLIIILSVSLDYHSALSDFLDWRVICFSSLVQLVSYAYSYAFRHLNVNQVTVAGKLSDLCIPIGIMLSTGLWNWTNYNFAVLTTLLCIPILMTTKNTQNNPFFKVWAIICLSLVLQASFSPFLARQDGSVHSSFSTFSFSLNVMLWRSIWSFIPAAAKHRLWLCQSYALLLNPLFLSRVILTFITQISFTYAISSPLSIIAWPILNMTGLIAMFLSAIFLSDKISKSEIFSISSISIAVIARFFTL